MGITIGALDTPYEGDFADPEPSDRPRWRRTPTQGRQVVHRSQKKLAKRIDDYFTKQYDTNKHPTLCDMAGEVGFDSVSQMVNHARRNGGEIMRAISRGMMAVAAGYEDMAQEGSRSALHMLSTIPQFDTVDPPAQTPQRPFIVQKELNVNITGVESHSTQGMQLTEQEAYMQLIKHKTYEEITQAIEKKEKTIEGDYQILSLSDDPEAPNG